MSRHSETGSGREEILKAALGEFAAHGFSGATTAAIARKAGVTQPLVHHHFGSKQGLWEAVLDDLFRDLQGVLEKARAEVEGAERPARLRHLLRSFVLFSGRRPELSRLIRTESTVGSEAFEKIHATWLKKLVRFMEQEISEAVADGTLRPVDPRFAYFVIVGASTHAFATAQEAKRVFGLDMAKPETIAAYADFTVEVLVRGLEAKPAKR